MGDTFAAQPLAFNQATPSGLLIGGYGVFKGFTCEETSGTALARFRLWDTGITRTLLAAVRLAASESVRDWYSESGVQFQGGVFLEFGSGAFQGSVFVIPGVMGLPVVEEVSESGVLGDYG